MSQTPPPSLPSRARLGLLPTLWTMLLVIAASSGCDPAKAEKRFFAGRELAQLVEDIWPGVTPDSEFMYGAGMRGRVDIASLPCTDSPGELGRATIFLLRADSDAAGEELYRQIDSAFQFFCGAARWAVTDAEPGYFYLGGIQAEFRHRRINVLGRQGNVEISQYSYVQELPDHKRIVVVHGTSDHIDEFEGEIDAFLSTFPR